MKGRLGDIELHLAGAIEDRYRSDLTGEAKKLGITAPVFHGYVSDERLQALLEDSQVVCCLRYPVTEGGSASLVTALYCQRPLIVSNIASYSLVPDDLAYKVSYGESVEDVEEALHAILEDTKAAETRAAKARLWAKDRFAAEAYVDALALLLNNCETAQTFASLARDLVPSVTGPDGRAMLSVVPEFSDVMDWILESQTVPRSYELRA